MGYVSLPEGNTLGDFERIPYFLHQHIVELRFMLPPTIMEEEENDHVLIGTHLGGTQFPLKSALISWYGSVSRVATPPPPPMVWVPPPPPIPHAFCTRHCSETYISILLHARRCSETHIFILLDEPSRRIRWVDRAKLWRNANFKLQEWLRAVHRTLQCSANGIIYIYISMYIHIHKHQ